MAQRFLFINYMKITCYPRSDIIITNNDGKDE